MTLSRLERLIALIGPENLPQKLPLPKSGQETSTATVTDVDDFLFRNTDQLSIKRYSWAEEAAPISKPQPHSVDIPNLQNASMSTADANGRHIFDLRKGEPAPLEMYFCPFKAVSKFCYKFVKASLVQPIATAFFDGGKIYDRDWDLYYVSTDRYGLVVLIPQEQLQALFVEINAEFPDAKLEMIDLFNESGLVIDFEDLPEKVRPRWLGHSTSRAQMDSWTSRLDLEPKMEVTKADLSEGSLRKFEAKMENAREAAKGKSKRKGGQGAHKAVVKHQEVSKQMLRAQRYLGLLPSDQDSSKADDAQAPTLAIDVTAKVSHPFDMDAIFIAVDAEAYEKPPRMVTEVGIATLDTRDLRVTAPGEVGKEWHHFIRGRHFRVREYMGYVNSEYVRGCPDQFAFGRSEVVAKSDIASILTSCFHEPFSKMANDSVSEQISSLRITPEKRNLIIVGHDLGQDISYCHQIGFSILDRGNIFDTVDTASLYSAYRKDPQPRSLGGVLYDFDIVAWNLHNAGNDAVYTLQALLAICVQAAAKGGEATIENQAGALSDNAHEGNNGPDGKDKPQSGPSRTRVVGPHTLDGVPLDV